MRHSNTGSPYCDGFNVLELSRLTSQYLWKANLPIDSNMLFGSIKSAGDDYRFLGNGAYRACFELDNDFVFKLQYEIDLIYMYENINSNDDAFYAAEYIVDRISDDPEKYSIFFDFNALEAIGYALFSDRLPLATCFINRDMYWGSTLIQEKLTNPRRASKNGFRHNHNVNDVLFDGQVPELSHFITADGIQIGEDSEGVTKMFDYPESVPGWIMIEYGLTEPEELLSFIQGVAKHLGIDTEPFLSMIVREDAGQSGVNKRSQS